MTRPPIVVTILLVLACVPAAHMAGIVIWDVILRYLLNEAPVSAWCRQHRIPKRPSD
jgi:hypothetical protein